MLYLLREATPRDLDTLKEIEREVLSSGELWGESLSKTLKTKNSLCYIAEEQMKVKGYLLGAITCAGGKKRGVIKLIVVKPEARKSGVGRRLIEEFEKQMILREIDTLYIDVMTTEHDLIGWFLKRGYEGSGKFRNRFGQDKDALRLVKVFYFMKENGDKPTTFPDISS